MVILLCRHQRQSQHLPTSSLSPRTSPEHRATQTLLLQACYYNVDTGAPLFAAFFEDQAEVKREHAKQFLRYLRRHEGKICLPVIQRPDLDNWGTGIQALESALELENKLTKLLQDLKTLASANSETDLLRFMGKYLDKQKRNIGYLEHQLLYHRKVEKQAQEEDTFKKPAEVSGPGIRNILGSLTRKPNRTGPLSHRFG
ncbi:soma ferritin-like [Rhinolophus ferrumequinum]|uniref:soma ferritin-like n=1 Tax=Rhinolophus ferrumequinum TaxID=59479 RepID=UPI00140F7FC1|nr:soma ferritin-like [Rhinolophus ferrumequinum]